MPQATRLGALGLAVAARRLMRCWSSIRTTSPSLTRSCSGSGGTKETSVTKGTDGIKETKGRQRTKETKGPILEAAAAAVAGGADAPLHPEWPRQRAHGARLSPCPRCSQRCPVRCRADGRLRAGRRQVPRRPIGPVRGRRGRELHRLSRRSGALLLPERGRARLHRRQAHCRHGYPGILPTLSPRAGHNANNHTNKPIKTTAANRISKAVTST